MKIRPLGLVVAIEPEKAEQEEKTQSGIIIPKTKKKEAPIGTVIAVGNSTDEEDLVINVGDRVLYKAILSKIEDGGKEYYLLNQSDILATL